MKKRQISPAQRIYESYTYFAQAPKPKLKEKCNFKEIETNLEDAFKMFNQTGAKWSPVGGLEVAVRFGQVTRNHTDIDIEIDESQLPIFKEGMELQGYKLFEKLISVNINLPMYKKRLTLYKTCSINKNIIKKQIKLIHNDPDSVPYLLQAIDIKVCRHTPEGTIVNNKGELITINKPYNGKIIEFRGQPIRLRSIGFRTYIKSLETNIAAYKRDIDRYDNILLDTDRVKHI